MGVFLLLFVCDHFSGSQAVNYMTVPIQVFDELWSGIKLINNITKIFCKYRVNMNDSCSKQIETQQSL